MRLLLLLLRRMEGSVGIDGVFCFGDRYVQQHSIELMRGIHGNGSKWCIISI